MGTLAVDNGELTKLYGELAVRFNSLRSFFWCVRTQVNEHKTADGCK